MDGSVVAAEWSDIHALGVIYPVGVYDKALEAASSYRHDGMVQILLDHGVN